MRQQTVLAVSANVSVPYEVTQGVWDGVLLATPDRLVHLEWPYVNPLVMGSPTPPLTRIGRAVRQQSTPFDPVVDVEDRIDNGPAAMGLVIVSSMEAGVARTR